MFPAGRMRLQTCPQFSTTPYTHTLYHVSWQLFLSRHGSISPPWNLGQKLWSIDCDQEDSVSIPNLSLKWPCSFLLSFRTLLLPCEQDQVSLWEAKRSHLQELVCPCQGHLGQSIASLASQCPNIWKYQARSAAGPTADLRCIKSIQKLRPANFVHKGPNSKYSRLYGPHMVSIA